MRSGLKRMRVVGLVAALCLLSVAMEGRVVATPAQHPIEDGLIYFMMLDRFEDGDPSNNTAGLDAQLSRTLHGYDPTNMWWYHGGDLAGVRQRLDYLQGLGVSHIWTTPVLRNQWVQGSSAAFHGYWITDFLGVDPHFGSADELAGLVEDLRHRGMGYIMDIVVNHTADVIQYQENQYNYRRLSQPGYTPVIPPSMNNAKFPLWLNDTRYYHNRGNSTFSGESSIYGDFFGLDDLATGNPEVVQGMIDIYVEWLRRLPLTGFRIDTVKHVHLDLWRQFAPAMRRAAEEHGREGFYQFGEVWTGDAKVLSGYSLAGGLDATLDFGFAYATRAFLSQGQSATVMEQLFAEDDWYGGATTHANMQLVFLENHDGGMGRWNAFVRRDNPGISDAMQVRLHLAAHALLLFARGIPVLYYGSEQGFAGYGDPDAMARESMFPSHVAAHRAIPLVGTSATVADSNFSTAHPLYRGVARMADERMRHIALRRGAQVARPTNSDQVFAFARIDRDELVEFIFVVNNSLQSSRQVQLSTISKGARFHELLRLTDAGVVDGAAVHEADAAGVLQLNIPAASFMLLKADRPLPQRQEPLRDIRFNGIGSGGSILFTPGYNEGQRFPPRAMVTVDVDGMEHGEVTIGYSRSSTPEDFQLLAVDQQPPYRASLYLPDNLQAHETFSLYATANDLRGGLVTTAIADVRPRLGPQGMVVHAYGSDLGTWSVRVASADGTTQHGDFPLVGEINDQLRFAYIALEDVHQPVTVQLRSPGAGAQEQPVLRVLPAISPQVYLRPAGDRIHTTVASVYARVFIHIKGGSAATSARFWQSDPSHGPGIPLPAPIEVDAYGSIHEISAEQFPGWFADLPIQMRLSDAATEHVFALNPQLGSNRFYVDAEQGTVHLTESGARRQIMIHYRREDGDYGNAASTRFSDFWGLHLWDGAAQPTAAWTQPMRPSGSDSFGRFWQVPVLDDVPVVAYLLHRGDWKDPGEDQFLDLAAHGERVWQLSGADASAPYIHSIGGQGYFGKYASDADQLGRQLHMRLAADGMLVVRTIPGLIHHLEASADLRDWSPLSQPFTGDGTAVEVRLFDNAAAATFWRVRLANP